MITDLNCVDCEIHVIKLDVVLTNFTVLWGRIFSTLPSLVFVIELSADAGLSSYIGNVLRLVLVFQLLLLVCWKRHIPYIPFLWPSFSFSSFLRSIFPSRMLFPTPPPLSNEQNTCLRAHCLFFQETGSKLIKEGKYDVLLLRLKVKTDDYF